MPGKTVKKGVNFLGKGSIFLFAPCSSGQMDGAASSVGSSLAGYNGSAIDLNQYQVKYQRTDYDDLLDRVNYKNFILNPYELSYTFCYFLYFRTYRT